VEVIGGGAIFRTLHKVLHIFRQRLERSCRVFGGIMGLWRRGVRHDTRIWMQYPYGRMVGGNGSWGRYGCKFSGSKYLCNVLLLCWFSLGLWNLRNTPDVRCGGLCLVVPFNTSVI
jgi:hypothetical protein